MKRIIALCLLIMLMAAMAVPVAAYAADAGRRFTDANNDGYCDYAQLDKPAFADEDGDGICDNRGTVQRPYKGCGRGGRMVGCPGRGGC